MQKKDVTELAILDFVGGESRFTKFNKAIEAAGLVERFSSPNKFTVFAPTDEAFDKLAGDKVANLMKPEHREQLKRLLLLHVVPGALMAEDLKKADSLKTESGQTLNVSVSQDFKDIKLADAHVILPKAEVRNGIVYALDTVLMPIVAASAATLGSLVGRFTYSPTPTGLSRASAAVAALVAGQHHWPEVRVALARTDTKK